MPKKLPAPADALPVPMELIERRIYLIRGQKVMLDSDLAELYQIETKALNQAVRRNPGRFPEDFMSPLLSEESEALNRSQIVTGSQKHRDPRYLPYAFTELGVAMLSSVLNSDRAVQMNILLIRTFVKIRELLATHKKPSRKRSRSLNRRKSSTDRFSWRSSKTFRNSKPRRSPGPSAL